MKTAGPWSSASRYVSTAAMNELFDEFAKAHSQRHGYILAQTLSPVAPAGQPHRLRHILQSTNSHSIKGDLKHFVKTKTARKVKLDHDEVNGWVEVYAAYWNAVGEIVAGEEGKVLCSPSVSGFTDWC